MTDTWRQATIATSPPFAFWGHTMKRASLICCPSILAVGMTALVQNYAPPPPVKPSNEQLTDIKARLQLLTVKINGLKRSGVRDPILADIEVYLKAAELIVRHGEFYRKEDIDWTIDILDAGLLRAAQAARGDT